MDTHNHLSSSHFLHLPLPVFSLIMFGILNLAFVLPSFSGSMSAFPPLLTPLSTSAADTCNERSA